MIGMGPDDIPLFGMLKSRLGYLSDRQKLIAQNVANADTPGYQPRDLKAYSFQASLMNQSAGAGAPYRGGRVVPPGGVQMMATSASHNLKGSAFLEGMDWMRRKTCSVSTTSVRYFLPSLAFNFSWLVSLTN